VGGPLVTRVSGILSGFQIWLFSHFDHFLSGLYPALKPKIRIFCPDRDVAFTAIAGDPIVPSPCLPRTVKSWLVHIELH
jgi:hypothetical protein